MAYRVEEAGEALGIGRDLVFRLIKSGKLRSVMVVGRRLIPITAIQEFLSSG
jgi:excisionase family DNA binding protein